MLEIVGNLFDQHEADAICITTNGYVNDRGANIMGRGSAGEAKRRWPGIELNLGHRIRLLGNQVHLLTHEAEGFTERFLHSNQPLYTARIHKVPYHIVTFPTKPIGCYSAELLPSYQCTHQHATTAFPGWMAKSNLPLIVLSATQLVRLADRNKWNHVVLPRPGCGAGELSWEDQVRPMLREVLDDRFRAIHFG